MNRLFGALAVLAGVLLIVITGFCINTSTAASVEALLTESLSYARHGNTTQAASSLKKAKNLWDHHMETMLLFVSHGKLDQIQETINIADSYIKSNEISLYLAECTTAKLLIDHFKNVEYPNINNIF